MANIEINSTPSRVQYTATSSQTEFAIPFPFNANGDLKVYQRVSGSTADDATDLLTITAEYTLTGAGSADGGTMTLVTGATTGDIVTIVGDDDIDRDTIINSPSKLSNTTLNTQFNNLVIYAKQLETQLNQLMLSYNKNESVDSGYLIDNVLPYLTASGVWRKNAGNTAIEVATLPAYPVGSVGGTLSNDNRVIKTDTSGSSNDIQETGITIDDSNNITGVGSLTASSLTYPTTDGVSGQVITTDGAGTLSFTNAGDGDVDGPASATDNAVVRFDSTTGKLVQNSGVIIDDSNNITGVAGLTATGAISGATIGGITEANLVDKTASETISGSWDFGSAGSLEIPNSATPTVNADGEVAIDTTVADFSTGIMKYYGGEEMGVVAMPIAQFTTPTDGHIITYNATNDEFELIAPAASGISAVVDDTTPQLGGDLDGNGFGVAFDTGTGILDENGNEQLMFTTTASAANYFKMTNAAAFGIPELSVDGSDANIYMRFSTKGTGTFSFGAGVTITSGNLLLSSGNLRIADTNGIIDSGNNEQLVFNVTASAVNHISMTNAATGNDPAISSAGDDVNVDLAIKTQGSGTISVQAPMLMTSGNYLDFGSASSFKISRGTSPTLAADGQIAVDTSVTDFSHGVLKYYGGEIMGVVAMPDAQFTSPTDGYVVAYNATNDEFELVSNAGVTASSQADQETSTSTTTFVTPGRQQYHPSAAKFWVEFDAITTTAINSSYNVTSVTDNGTGDTTVTIATDFSSANWCVVSSSAYDDNAPGAGNGVNNDMVNSFAVGTIRVGTVSSASAALDMQHVSIVGFGDH